MLRVRATFEAIRSQFMMRSRFLHLLPAIAALPMSACRLRPARPTRPLRKLQFEPQGNETRELVLLLPGRLSPPEEFVEFGIVDLVRKERPLARIVAPDLHLGYYMRGLADSCLHEEIIGPAKKQGLRVTIIGVSMGGLGALTYSLRFPGEVDEMLLLSPFVGDKELLAEIERAGGLEKWESPVGTPRSKAEALQKMWIEMKPVALSFRPAFSHRARGGEKRQTTDQQSILCALHFEARSTDRDRGWTRLGLLEKRGGDLALELEGLMH